MIERMEGMPAGVLGFAAKGEVTGEDYEQVLIPAVESALTEHDEISLLYVLGEDFTGYRAAALWADTKVGMGHMSSWKRIAVVTDQEVYRVGVKSLGFLISAEVKVFGNDEIDEAKRWVAG